MQIIIEYESSWRNSFLDGEDNTTKRNFIGSMTALGDRKVDNYKARTITKNTVMGVLNRLIGEQRKLYDVRSSSDYYFKDIEAVLTEEDIVDRPVISQETVYLRNISGSTDQNSFTGMIKLSDPWLSVSYAKEFWDVLWMSLEELFDFIKYNNTLSAKDFFLDPLNILDRLEEVKKIKVPLTDEISQIAEILSSRYPNFALKESANKVSVLPLYCSALYLKLDRLSEQYDTTPIRASRGGLTGVSHNGFTPKNLMERFTTGQQKIVWGNPYISSKFLKGEGEIRQLLNKASGKLIINLNISKEQARDLEEKIENAGVSSFYLGKKGLAYVTDIRP
ncbi:MULTISPECIES: type I-Fv CRISPR-associated protein Cas5fv [Acinetobacter]|jgi:Cas5fv helical domain|uniref:type I-Fv CRISPR-associated protein Cas5fv n=1 Tax=Acinetobacter TaxID=469 RepID=UPI0015D1BDFE|nr:MULTISPECIES: type I-Fv CRISPR-associated protein Cas5fv [Acinetobacter]MDY6484018.1 type I-Fv CRISPR-associated protein Cas5fv [Acinetobacter faecalis]